MDDRGWGWGLSLIHISNNQFDCNITCPPAIKVSSIQELTYIFVIISDVGLINHELIYRIAT